VGPDLVPSARKPSPRLRRHLRARVPRDRLTPPSTRW
jgi:hypothetical protein